MDPLTITALALTQGPQLVSDLVGLVERVLAVNPKSLTPETYQRLKALVAADYQTARREVEAKLNTVQS